MQPTLVFLFFLKKKKFKDPQEQDSLDLGNELIPFGADYS